MAVVSEKGRKLIQRYESLRLVAYDDGTGVWTIGWGHTAGVRPGDAWTREQADEAFARDLRFFELGVENSLDRPATQGQFDAMVSLAYNTGFGDPRRNIPGFLTSSVLRLFNAGDLEGAAEKFIEWNKGGGRIMLGLVRRRAAEIVRFCSNE